MTGRTGERWTNPPSAAAGPRLVFTTFRAPLGWIAAVASSRGVRRMSLPAATELDAMREARVDGAGIERAPEVFRQLEYEVCAYLHGEAVRFTIPLDLEDAPGFFRAAWQACLRIPRGERRSYQWLAEQAGNQRASRAAGQAMARNPIPLIIPCHRVVGSGGGLHGYGGGLGMKEWLLQMEEIRGSASSPGEVVRPKRVEAEG